MRYFGLVAFLLASCGPSQGTGTQTPPAAYNDPQFAAVQPVIQRNCGDCHNGGRLPAFNSPEAFRGSAAKAEITSGSMPLGRAMSAADKAVLLAYLNP
jgi:uncharacterized membrane protein